MALARLIHVAEEQRRLLSQYTLTNPDTQIDTLKHLSNIYLDQASTITTIIKNHEESLAEDCSPILDEVKAVLGKLQEGRFTFGSPTRKSFEAIYTSQSARDSESSDLKRRTNKQYTRALEIQKLGCDGAIVLAGALTTSTWSHLMTSPKFKYILENMPKPPPTCSQVLLHTLETWGDEPPLANCAAFTNGLTALRARSNEPSAESDGATSGRHIQFAFSNAPFAKIPSVVDKLLDAIMHSRQWQEERNQGQLFSSCVTVFIPNDIQQDGSVNIVIGRKTGFKIQQHLELDRLKLL